MTRSVSALIWTALGLLTVFTVLFAAASSLAGDQSTNAESHVTDTLTSAVTTIAVTALVGGVGWIAAYVLNGLRDDRTKRVQLTIDHASTQIREFYAPLVALTDQLNTLAEIKDEVVKGKTQEISNDLAGTFYNKFFLPIHEEINAILKTKVHLLEGASTPLSFGRYFEHYASEKAYWQLAQAGKEVAQMRVSKYPSEFYWDVRRGYQTVQERYEEGLKELRHPRAAWPFIPGMKSTVAGAPSSISNPTDVVP